MSTFGSEVCATLADPTTCAVGAVIDMQTSTPITVQSITPPTNGIMKLAANGRLSLSSRIADPVDLSWKDRGEVSRDFQCAANWVVKGTNANPSFASPCYWDIVDFSSVSFMWLCKSSLNSPRWLTSWSKFQPIRSCTTILTPRTRSSAIIERSLATLSELTFRIVLSRSPLSLDFNTAKYFASTAALS